jgi:hypothetical protein
MSIQDYRLITKRDGGRCGEEKKKIMREEKEKIIYTRNKTHDECTRFCTTSIEECK